MKETIRVVGVGPGHPDYLPPIVHRVIGEAEVLFGSRRALEPFSGLGKEEIVLGPDIASETDRIIALRDEGRKVAVLVSGDPGLYSLLPSLLKRVSPDELEVIPGISSFQLAMARLGRPWQDVGLVSLHGREAGDLAAIVREKGRVCFLLDGRWGPQQVAEVLTDSGIEGEAVVLENLSYPTERAAHYSIAELAAAGDIPRDNEALKVLYVNIGRSNPLENSGRFYGIGVGPGDPELLTLKAARVLQEADVIFYPASASKRPSIALQVIQGAIRTEARLEELVFPMTKDREVLREHWAKAARLVEREVALGKKTAFITLGDPMLYSTYVYLLGVLKEYHPEVPITTIPGVSAPFACAAAGGISLAEGEEKVAIVPGDSEQLPAILESFETVVILKVGSKLPKMLDLLDRQGLTSNALLVKRVGSEDEEIEYDLAGFRNRLSASGEEGYLSTLVVKRGGLHNGFH